MTSTGKLRKSIDTARQLSDLVGTMETLAAVNIRQYESAVRAIDDYVANIEFGFQIVLRRSPELAEPQTLSEGRTAIVVFGTDQGLCGAINSKLAGQVVEIAEQRADSWIVPVGHRVAQILRDEGLDLFEELRPPHSVAAIASLVAEILGQLGEWQETKELRDVVVVYNRPNTLDTKGGGRGGFETLQQRILPLDPAWLDALAKRPWTERGQPTFSDEPDQLFSWLVREWLFARLFLACAASLAAENASRLETTHAAGLSIDERLGELERRYRSLRQSTITEELMDLYRG